MLNENSDWDAYYSLRKNKIAINIPFVKKKAFKNTAKSLLLKDYSETTPGVVYLFREFISEEKNSQLSEKIATKIGYCKLGSIDQRLEDINKHHYRNLYIAYAQKVDDAKALELVMHLRYKKDNISGEWFNLSEYQIRDAIRFLNTEKVKNGGFMDWFWEGGENCVVAKEHMDQYYWDHVSATCKR